MALGNRSITFTIDLVKGTKFTAGIQLFRLITDGVAGVAAVSKGAAVESVKLAASFERTQNALRVYAGSLTAAVADLKRYQQVASQQSRTIGVSI